MNSNLENRAKARFEHVTAVTVQNKKIGVQRNARMFNYSGGGVYIEADHRLEPETKIHLGVANSPFAAEPDKYESIRGVIRWRKALKQSVYYYGYGIQLLIAESFGNGAADPHVGSRRHARVDYNISVKYKSDNQTYVGTTQNVSKGGVFIKTQDPVAVGQTIRVDIPIKKKGKIKRLTGRVTWSTRNGFGVKFIRTK